MYVDVLLDFVSVCQYVPGAFGGQERTLDTLGLESQAGVSHHVGIKLGIKPKSSGGATSALSHQAISPAFFIHSPCVFHS